MKFRNKTVLFLFEIICWLAAIDFGISLGKYGQYTPKFVKPNINLKCCLFIEYMVF